MYIAIFTHLQMEYKYMFEIHRKHGNRRGIRGECELMRDLTYNVAAINVFELALVQGNLDSLMSLAKTHTRARAYTHTHILSFSLLLFFSEENHSKILYINHRR